MQTTDTLEQTTTFYKKTPVIIKILIDFEDFSLEDTLYKKEVVSGINKTALYLSSVLPNIHCAYIHSDEILLLMFEDSDTQWLGGQRENLISVVATLASKKLNEYFPEQGNYTFVNAFNVPFYKTKNYFELSQERHRSVVGSFFMRKYLFFDMVDTTNDFVDNVSCFWETGRVIQNNKILDSPVDFKNVSDDFFGLKINRACYLCANPIVECMGSVHAGSFIEFARSGMGEVREICPKCSLSEILK